MKIALFGYGKMGKMIERIAEDRGDKIVARLGRQTEDEEEPYGDIAHADVCIDFSSANAVIEHIRAAAHAGKPLVIGTTGWETHFEEAKCIVARSGIGCLYAPNFSVGVHLFKALVEMSAKLFAPFHEYDVSGFEAHHSKKVDSPSGTAKYLSEVLLKYVTRKKQVCWDRCEGQIAEDAIHFPSLRTGSIPGTHSVTFDSDFDTITISHQARGREGFAQGALDAAKWIKDKSGFYTLDEMLAAIAETPQPGAPTT